MRWEGRRQSGNVVDRRGMGGRGMAIGGGGLGCGTIVIIILFLLLGGDPQQLVDLQQQGGGPGGANAPLDPGEAPMGEAANDPAVQFVRVVLADTEDVWNEKFAEIDRQYEEPTLEIFSRQAESACGFASAAVGPFYCPRDRKVYIDLSFFRELTEKYRAAGDFARAYVIAHEVGHHVQNLLGISDRVQAARGELSKAEYNKLSVRLELQADYFAGVFARYVKDKGYLETGDIEEAIDAASAIGDDKLQEQAQGYVVPDSFTHGTSAQRARWFNLGYKSGDWQEHDPFKMRDSQL